MLRWFALVLLFSPLASGAVELTLVMPEDPGGFTSDAADCRDAPIRDCRGILLVDPAGSVSLRGVHAGFRIFNDGAEPIDDLWVRLDDFGDADLLGIVALGPAESGLVQLGSLPAGESALAFFHLVVSDSTEPLPTGPEVRPDVTLFNGPPATGVLLSANETMDACPVTGRLCRLPDGSVQVPMIYIDTIEALPIQTYQVQAESATVSPGEAFTATAIGNTGKLGVVTDYDDDGDPDALIALAPAPYEAWPADALRLTDIRVTTSGVEACPLADCTCSADPPAPGECDFVRADGGAPACELRTQSLPDIDGPTCVVEEFAGTLQLIVDTDSKRDFHAEYVYRATVPTGETVLFPVMHVNSGAQLKHTDVSALALCDVGNGVEPQASACCNDPGLTCISVEQPSEEVFADGFEGP